MKRILNGNAKWWLSCLLTLLVGAGIILCLWTNINYDLSKYLPEDARTAEGLALLEERFGVASAVQIMTDDVPITDGEEIANRIAAVDGVASVVWLGSATDLSVPLERIDPSLLARFYRDGALLYTITLDCGTYDKAADDIVAAISEAMGDTAYAIRGDVIDNIESRRVASEEIFKILLIVVPIALLVLLFVGRSWFEPLLILGNLGIAVILNMGTNALLGSVSYITMTMAMALQLALSLDYSIFLLHRYHEERDRGESVIATIATATKKMFGSVTGSAFTTIAGFLALFLMRYTIGFDIGIVLSKGIFFSYLTTILFLPVLLYFATPLLEKTAHRPLFERHLPKPKATPGRGRGHRYIVILFCVLSVAAWYLQGKNEYLYGNSAVADPESPVTIDRATIETAFGPYSPVIILAEDVTAAEEAAFVAAILSSPYVRSVDSLSAIADVSVPRELLPATLLDLYVSGTTTRIVVMLSIDSETTDLYEAVAFLETATQATLGDAWLVGYAPATSEIRTTVLGDADLVLWVTFLSIAFVILILFRTAAAPILLTIVIQAAVWMNFAVIGLEGSKTLYIGYLIVTALQMGGTVDYGILFTSRYLEYRKEYGPAEAIRLAGKRSTVSILTSSLVLAAAGFAEAFVSKIPAVSGIGMLIGRGALLSALVILLFLPSILFLFDRFLVPKALRQSSKGDHDHA